MAGTCDETVRAAGTVRYNTAARLPLPDLPNSTKRRIWRDRQIQTQALLVCGTQGERETQALFRCPECGSYTHADVQATFNVNEAGNPGLYPSAQDVTYGGRDSRHKMLEEAVGVFLDSTGDDGSVTNKYACSGLHGHSGI